MSTNSKMAAADPDPAMDQRQLFRLVLPPIMLPIFLAVVDSTIVTTALPAMAASFGEVQRISWVVVGYLLANTIAAPVYGRLADMFGRRQLMQMAIGLFCAASVLCALSTSLPMLILARVLQGLGGGGLMTLSQALVGERVPARQRGHFQGYLAAGDRVRQHVRSGGRRVSDRGIWLAFGILGQFAGRVPGDGPGPAIAADQPCRVAGDV